MRPFTHSIPKGEKIYTVGKKLMAFPRLGMEGSDHWTGQRGLEKKYSAVQPGVEHT